MHWGSRCAVTFEQYTVGTHNDDSQGSNWNAQLVDINNGLERTLFEPTHVVNALLISEWVT